jgi:hypothetical protein
MATVTMPKKQWVVIRKDTRTGREEIAYGPASETSCNLMASNFTRVVKGEGDSKYPLPCTFEIKPCRVRVEF